MSNKSRIHPVAEAILAVIRDGETTRNREELSEALRRALRHAGEAPAGELEEPWRSTDDRLLRARHGLANLGGAIGGRLDPVDQDARESILEDIDAARRELRSCGAATSSGPAATRWPAALSDEVVDSEGGRWRIIYDHDGGSKGFNLERWWPFGGWGVPRCSDAARDFDGMSKLIGRLHEHFAVVDSATRHGLERQLAVVAAKVGKLPTDCDCESLADCPRLHGGYCDVDAVTGESISVSCDAETPQPISADSKALPWDECPVCAGTGRCHGPEPPDGEEKCDCKSLADCPTGGYCAAWCDEAEELHGSRGADADLRDSEG